MHIAVEGCSHGELDVIYDAVVKLQDLNGFKIDALICCGDFQSVRNEKDLKCMAVPIKYMAIQDFHKYHSGEKKAPVLTIFIGGNHEASNYLQELPYGGWVAPNIYYLGYAGVINFGGLRIGGLSGIYKGHDYLKGHYEISPYNKDSIRSVYHVRNLEVFRLKQLSGSTNIFMSHDWPRGIYHHGNKGRLMARKKHFKSEIESNTLGSRPAEELIHKIKPNYWFSGHLHVKFPALIRHKNDGNKSSVTKFLALDKCLPRREFLQVLEIGDISNDILKYDAEWLTILRLTNHLLSTSSNTNYMPGPNGSDRYCFTPSKEEIQETIELMEGNLTIPSQFISTAPIYKDTGDPLRMNDIIMPDSVLNPQTVNLCKKLNIDDPISLLKGSKRKCLSPRDFRHDTSLNRSELEVTLDASRTSNILDETTDEDNDLTSGDIIMEMDLNDISPIFSSKKRLNITDGQFSSSSMKDISFISRKLNLSMPINKTTKELISDTNNTIVDELPIKEVDLEIPNVLKAASPHSSEKTLEISPPKKIKRRNQALYSSQEENCD